MARICRLSPEPFWLHAADPITEGPTIHPSCRNRESTQMDDSFHRFTADGDRFKKGTVNEGMSHNRIRVQSLHSNAEKPRRPVPVAELLDIVHVESSRMHATKQGSQSEDEVRAQREDHRSQPHVHRQPQTVFPCISYLRGNQQALHERRELKFTEIEVHKLLIIVTS